jgi:cell division protein FtsA
MLKAWLPRRAGKQPRRRRKSIYFSVVEPGATTLRLLVVEATGSQTTVWGWAERQTPGGTDLDIHWPASVCEEVETEAEQMARELSERWLLPDQMVVGLPASLLRGGAWPVAQRRSRPDRPVEERELRALLERALRLAVNRLVEPEETGWLVLDAAPVSLTVDGRRVTDPVGFRGQELGAMVFASLARRETVQAWQTVARFLEFSTLTLTAAPLALTTSLSGPQGILLDVGGATTDLIRWHGGGPVALDSLPIGGMALTRLLVQKWRLTLSQAERLKQAYAAAELDEEDRAEVLEVITPALRVWLEAVEATLTRMNEDEALPPQIYLLGGGSVLPEMADATRALAWSQRLSFARYPQVGHLKPTDVPGVVNRTELGRGAGDVPALALAAWAARESRPPDRPARLLAELCHG